MIVWVNASPGLGRAVAFDVIVIGGVSTLFFNGNPLLRFDGYDIMADLIEIPNLATRANSCAVLWSSDLPPSRHRRSLPGSVIVSLMSSNTLPSRICVPIEELRHRSI